MKTSENYSIQCMIITFTLDVSQFLWHSQTFFKRCTIEIQSNITISLQNDHLNYHNVTLPEPVYDYIYAGRQPMPVALRDVETYVNQIQEEIEKFREVYGV